MATAGGVRRIQSAEAVGAPRFCSGSMKIGPEQNPTGTVKYAALDRIDRKVKESRNIVVNDIDWTVIRPSLS